MRIREGFALKEIAGQCVVIALGEASSVFNGIIRLNETGKLIWEKLSCGADRDGIADAMIDEYDVDRDTALADIDKFIEKLRGENILED